jgi:hypothetical protein
MALAGMAGEATGTVAVAGMAAAGAAVAGTVVEAIAGNSLEKHARRLVSVPTGRAR